MPGSSPLTRGKQALPDVGRAVMRLIPAHAGKTVSQRRRRRPVRAHPRSRGENDTLGPTGFRLTGSSPLTRGKRGDDLHGGDTAGLIPAHVGKTSSPASPASRPRAHPRSRGENLSVSPRPARPSGSSPLTRGKRSPSYLSDWLLGLIPAHAGKTKPRSSPTAPCTAHPRSRGENRRPGHANSSTRGSSPLTRGKPDERRGHALGAGLIPAHAGKTP